MDQFSMEQFAAAEESFSMFFDDIGYKNKEGEMNRLEDQMGVMSRFYPGARPRSRNQSGVIQNQSNGSTATASPVLTRNLSTASLPDRSERKRQIDQAYRQKLKNLKAEMETNLKNLTGENESLKTENQYLKEDNAYMNQTLADQANEIERLRSDLLQLKHDHDKQNVLLQTLSGLLSDPLRLENEKLKDENASLRSNANLNSNLPGLLEENAKLKVENKVLKVQNDALCGKIIGEYDKKRAIS